VGGLARVGFGEEVAGDDVNDGSEQVRGDNGRLNLRWEIVCDHICFGSVYNAGL
jgi:hypothetical protein